MAAVGCTLALLTLLLCSERAACKEQVDVGGFQHVVVDLVQVGKRTDLLSNDVTLAESLELAPDTGV